MHIYDHDTDEYQPLTTDQLLSCLPGPTGNQTEQKLKAFRDGVAVEELWGMDDENDGGEAA